ncbi:MAG: methionine ABC transporter ATP-binding protein [Erysipelotrichaceae bacterium]|jgi:D-methionine transport system ATP-binding protein|nr:methionine ABC transporter ATP-binding protein [Erysipelotrichaceae bacterium]
MIKLENVSKSFDDLDVLKDISLEISDHEIYGIIGQSGAGKSTLLRCINGLEDYQSGTISVDGVTVSVKDKKKLHLLQKDMGMIFQNFNLLERLDVYDNVALPMKFWGIRTSTPEAKEKIEGLIRMVGLEDKIHARPRELSGGQKQRVAIARALVLDPKILLCDEATSALDPAITRGILTLLQQINREMGITIIVVTHQMEVVKQICEKVAFIKEGRVVAIGKPEELFIHPNRDIKAFLHEDSDLLPEDGVNVQLFFTDESADEPVISQMARKLNLDFSISWAKLEDFRSNIYGSLVITIKEEDKEKVLSYLDSVKVLWEVLN